jgi:hypothetical protein
LEEWKNMDLLVLSTFLIRSLSMIILVARLDLRVRYTGEELTEASPDPEVCYSSCQLQWLPLPDNLIGERGQCSFPTAGAL